MIDPDLSQVIPVKGYHIKTAVSVLDLIFIKIGPGGVDNGIPFAFAYRTQRRPKAFKGVVLYLNKDQLLPIPGYDVDLPLLRMEIPAEDPEAFLFNICAGGIFAPIAYDLAGSAHIFLSWSKQSKFRASPQRFA